MSDQTKPDDPRIENPPAGKVLPAEKRRWQFGLRTMISLCVVAACVLWAWTSYTRPYRENQRAIERVELRGGAVRVAWFGPTWLEERRFRLRSFERVVEINLSKSPDLVDDDLALFAALDELTLLDLRETSITETGCDHLKDLPKLSYLYLNKTGVQKLSKVGDFPALRVVESGNVERYDKRASPPKTSLLASEGAGEIFVLRKGEIDMAAGLALAVAPSSEALLTVAGPASYCQVNQVCDLGGAGRAKVQVQDGGHCEFSGDLRLANNPAGEGTLTLAQGRTWIRGDMTVGNGGTGTVDVSERSEVTCDGSIVIGNGDQKPGVVRCSGSLSSKDMNVGTLGQGTLELEKTGLAIVGNHLVLGRGASSRGIVSVGTDSKLEVRGQTEVGGDGAAELRLAAGALFSTTEIKIGPRGEVHGVARLPKTTNHGLVAPGGPQATLAVEGAPTSFLSGYQQTESGGLRIEIEANQSTRLKVEGVARLAGRLELHLKGPKPPPGTNYVVVTASRVESRFQKVLATGEGSPEDWQVTYTPTEVRVTFGKSL